MRKTVTAWILALVLAVMLAPALADMPQTDRAGNPIVVPEKAERVIALAPSIVQVLVDLEQADKLVAIDTYSAGTKGLPEALPAFEMMAPDMEQMIALAPDLVFVSGMSLADGSDPFVQLTDMGVCVAYIPSSSSIEGILEDTLFIGQVMGNEAGAQALNDTLSAAIETFRKTPETPVPVYFEIGSMPSLYSFGSGTFLGEMIEILGGANIFADREGWVAVSEEAVVAASPMVIFTNEDWKDDAVAEIVARPGWESIPAVAERQVYLIGADISSQPNHRIVYALEEMAKAFEAVE